MNDKSENSIPDGYKVMTGGILFPFISLRVSDKIEAEYIAVRAVTKTEKVKVGGKTVEAEKTRLYYDLKLLTPFTNIILDKKGKEKERHDFTKGASVTLSGRGAIDRAFHKAALEAEEVEMTTLPKDRKEWPAAKFNLLTGSKVYIERQEDGEIKTGEWKGKDAHQYIIGFKLPVAA